MSVAPTTLLVHAQDASPCQSPTSTNWSKILQQFLIIYVYSSLEQFTFYYFPVRLLQPCSRPSAIEAVKQ